MSTHFVNKIPPRDSNWCILEAYTMEDHVIIPEFIKKLYEKGCRKIYISFGPRYVELQQKYQLTMNDSDYDLLKNVLFECVIIDNVNCIHGDMCKLLPSKLYIKSQNIAFKYNDTWDSIPFYDPHTTDHSDAITYFKEFDSFNRAPSYIYSKWYQRDIINIVMGRKQEPSPRDKYEMDLKQERDHYKFGHIIQIFRKYAVNNWCSISKSVSGDAEFEPIYLYEARTRVNHIPITFTYKEKKYRGGCVIKPIEKFERVEFELIFGFGPRCLNFTTQETRYFYKQNMGLLKTHPNSIYKFFEKFMDEPFDKELYKFMIWIGINYLGVMNSHKEYECIEELRVAMNQETLSKEEIDSIIYPYSVSL